MHFSVKAIVFIKFTMASKKHDYKKIKESYRRHFSRKTATKGHFWCLFNVVTLNFTLNGITHTIKFLNVKKFKIKIY